MGSPVEGRGQIAAADARAIPRTDRLANGRPQRRPGTESSHDSLLEGDGFELPVREHRAMAPSHGFAAASHREAALRGAPASYGETAFRGAAGSSVRRAVAAMRSTRREMWCSAAVQAARYRGREARRHAGRRRKMPDRGCGRRVRHGRRLEIQSGR